MIAGKAGPSLEFLKLHAEKFEEGIIFKLDLSSRQLGSTGDIDQCSNLFILNLSKNQLVAVDGLKKLGSLAFLNVSHNRISDLGPLGNCGSLVRIDAQANDISNILTLRPLSRLSQLKALTLQNIKKDEANPVCKDPSYRMSALNMLQNISRLDFVPKNIDLELPKLDDDRKIDLTGLQLRSEDLYGDFQAIEQSLADQKKAQAKAELMCQKIDDARVGCLKKQEQATDLLKDIEKLLG